VIQKIISGGQPGVEQAALDVAIRMGIDCGGLIPTWRKEEDESIVEKYNLEEMPNTNYARTTEQNILDSDGTLIISQGDILASSALHRRLAERYQQPWLYIDLNRIVAFQAAEKIVSWIAENEIEILNVTGRHEGIGLELYRITSEIMETVFHLLLIRSAYRYLSDSMQKDSNSLKAVAEIPQTVKQAVEILLSRLSFKEKTKIANMSESDLEKLSPSLGIYIKNEFRLWQGNEELEKSSREISKEPAEDSASVIIRALWKNLQQSDRVLRVVK
jgi:hypothetical protein